MSVRKTTEPGYVNKHGQVNRGCTGAAGNDHNQYVYRMYCPECLREYGANGSDIWQRKCPFHQDGKPGLPV